MTDTTKTTAKTATPVHTPPNTTAATPEPTLKDEATKQMEAAKGAARKEAQEAAEAARDRAETHFDAARDSVAHEVSQTAGNVREAGAAFEPGSLASTAADRIADSLADAASAVRDADMGSVQEDLTNFARRNPLVFFGGAAVLGFMAGRMMKASERAEHAPPPAPYTPPQATRDTSQWGYQA